MRSFFVLSLFLLMSFSLHGAAQSAEVNQPLPADVRLLVDISGSMKKTDPQNLRKPALELLVQLMPKGSRAGIWTFGQSVNLLVPHRVVDDAWLKTASEKSSGITSIALYTNIGAVLEQATYDHDALSKDYRNNIILLTDGVVDIGPEPERNARERARILDELLPRLKAAGYIIHTIALSDAADKELMQALSLNTDGVFAVSDTADELMATFLRIFDQAVPVERLPLDGNVFLVDDSVEEFTALIFRKADAAPTVLISPEGTSYTASVVGDGVTWLSTKNYDLMTVQQPVTGEWQLKADVDPDNRVTVVSDLQLQVTLMANNLLVGESLELQFFFQEENQRVTRTEFLRLLEIDGHVTRVNDERQWRIPLTKRDPPIDGLYQESLDVLNETGEYVIRLAIDGKTFKREYKHNLTVLSPFVVNMHKQIGDQSVHYLVDVIPDTRLIDPNKTHIEAIIKSSTGLKESQTLLLNEQQQWQLRFTPTSAADYSIELTANGQRMNGAKFEETLPAHYFSYPQQGDPTNVAAPDTPAAQPDPEPEVAETPDVVVEPAPVVTTPGMNKVVLYAGIALANVLVFGLAFFAYRMINSKKADEALEQLEPATQGDADEKLAMQEVGQPSQIIDVSDDNDSAHIAMDEIRNGDDDLLDLEDLEGPDDLDKT